MSLPQEGDVVLAIDGKAVHDLADVPGCVTHEGHTACLRAYLPVRVPRLCWSYFGGAPEARLMMLCLFFFCFIFFSFH